MYLIEIELKNRKEYVKFNSMWCAITIAQRYAMYWSDATSVTVMNTETGEIGMIIENKMLTYIAASNF